MWTLYGYSLAFGDGGSLNEFIGGLAKAFLKGVDANSAAPTFSTGDVIPEYAYFVFQMTFAMITPALIVGAFAERIKFSAVMLFILLWVTVIYFPIAHWVWAVADPNAIVDAATELAAATTTRRSRRRRPSSTRSPIGRMDRRRPVALDERRRRARLRRRHGRAHQRGHRRPRRRAHRSASASAMARKRCRRIR